MPKLNTDKPLAAMWDSYRKLVIPANASAVQITETRQAFYAGATALYHFLMDSVSLDDEITGGDMLLMETIQAEVMEFAAEFDKAVLPHA